MSLFNKKEKEQEDKVQHLRSRIAELRAQRDKIRNTRSSLQFKLNEAQMELAEIKEEHLSLWEEKNRSLYNLALPAAELSTHIAYRKDAEFDPGLHMVHSGYLAAKRLKAVARKNADGSGVKRILDFGCGCGRVSRFFTDIAPDAEVFGCDIDKPAIDWCQENLKDSGTYFVSNDRPALPVDESNFDAITALSVFTHLPEDMQFEWLAELAERLRPGGLLLATVHGESFYRFVPADDRAQFEEKGFLYADLGKTPDLPDYYLTAFHTHDYIKDRWSKWFEIKEILPQTIPQVTVRQDLVVLQRK